MPIKVYGVLLKDREFSSLGTAVPLGGYGKETISMNRNNTSYGGATGSIQITTGGRPIKIAIISQPGASNEGRITLTKSGGTSLLQGYIRCLRDGSTEVGAVRYFPFSDGTNAASESIPSSSCHWTDPIAAGTYTYTIEAKTSSGTTIDITDSYLEVYEL